MELTVHRGARDIGGSCVELKSKKTMILIDIGLPLNTGADIKENDFAELKRSGVLLDIKGLYKDEDPAFDAVFLSHSHPDHYGVLPYINPEIPVYASEGTLELVRISGYFNGIDFNSQSLRPIQAGEKVIVGDIAVTSHLVDHSAFDAFAFLAEVEGKNIFYSGDFRGHGRKSSLFKKICKSPPNGIDYLLLEGTSLSREAVEPQTEKDVENTIADILREHSGPTFIACSSQNIDRIVSIYRACVKASSVFVIDPYTAFILSRLKRFSPRLPQYDWGKNIRIFFAPNSFTKRLADDGTLFQFKSAKISFEEIIKNKDKMAIKDSYMVRRVFSSKKQIRNARLIFSMWPGYLEELKPFWESFDVPTILVHTSGHAAPSDLKRFVKALNPSAIIPIHTNCPQDYPKQFGDVVKVLEDGKALII